VRLAAGALLCATCVLASVPARAANAQAQARERAARKACLVGEYAKGVSILSDLFLDSKDPTYIYNQARCLEQNRRYEEAIARFQEYLRIDTKAEAADRAEAEKHIADCQALLAKQGGQMVIPVAPVAPLAVPAPGQPLPIVQLLVQSVPAPAAGQVLAPAVGTAVAQAPVRAPPPASEGSRLGWVPWALAGVGALVVGYGGWALYEDGRPTGACVGTVSGRTCEYYSSKSVAIGGMVGGGVLMVTGAIWGLTMRGRTTTVAASANRVVLNVRF